MSTQPNITVCKPDYDKLHSILAEMRDDDETVNRLIDELERAEVVPEEKLPPSVVRMHSKVTFTVLSTEKTFTYQLVYPHEKEVSNALSVLTPVGSALLGLSIGQEIAWPLEGNRSTRVRIDSLPQ